MGNERAISSILRTFKERVQGLDAPQREQFLEELTASVLAPEVQSILLKIHEEIAPSIEEAGQAMRSRAGRKLQTPLDVRAEWLLVLGGLIAIGMQIEHSELLIAEGWDQHPSILAAGIAPTLHKAQLFLWDSDIRLAAIKYAPHLPPHHVEDIEWPFPIMWWTYDTDVSVSGAHNKNLAGVGILLSRTELGVQITPILQDDQKGGFVAAPGIALPPDAKYPEDFPDENDKKGYHDLMSLMGFMQSRIIEQRRIFPARGIRKRHPLTLGKEITVVQLRNKEYAGGNQEPSGNTLEYNFRWMVSGHWRNQWYATEEKHKLKWIDAYIKGPEEKPLKTTIYNVVR